MARRRIDYNQIPAEFQHLPKTEQSKLMYMAQDIAKIIKKLPPELMDSFSRDIAKLGEEKADIKEFDDLFKKVMEKAEIALERDREDKRKAKEFEKANAPKKIEKCKCDFLPNLPAYKNITCERTDCVKKI